MEDIYDVCGYGVGYYLPVDLSHRYINHIRQKIWTIYPMGGSLYF